MGGLTHRPGMMRFLCLSSRLILRRVHVCDPMANIVCADRDGIHIVSTEGDRALRVVLILRCRLRPLLGTGRRMSLVPGRACEGTSGGERTAHAE